MLTGESLQPSTLWLLNISAAASTIGSLMDWVPAVSAIFGLILFAIQIVDKISSIIERRRKAKLDLQVQAKNAGIRLPK